MSVSLIWIEAGTARELPIATDGCFRRLWEPASRELGLAWVPAFRHGLALRPEDLAPIRAELARLREWVARRGDDAWLERLRALDRALETLSFAPELDAAIG